MGGDKKSAAIGNTRLNSTCDMLYSINVILIKETDARRLGCAVSAPSSCVSTESSAFRRYVGIDRYSETQHIHLEN